MRRIRSTGCGYSLVPGQSYTCNGVAKLTDMFKTTPTNIFGTEVIRTTRSEEYSNEEWIGNPENLLKGSIDNYAQLPQAFEGFVMTLTPILDMDASAAGPEVPELECRINFDPFAKVVGSVLNTTPEYTSDSETRNDGFLNLYNSVFPNYTKTVYVEAKTQEQLQTESVADTLIYYDMPAYLSGSTVTEEEGIGWVIQPNTDQETGKTSYVSLIAGPGILEPMLDTSFPPIGVDTITGPDIIGDFTMWEFNTIAQWQNTVDTRLNGINLQPFDYKSINGMLNLENAENKRGGCNNFTISVSSDQAVLGTNQVQIPTYSISYGDIRIDDTALHVDGKQNINGGFDAFLDIFYSSTTSGEESTSVLGATVTTAVDRNGNPTSTPTNESISIIAVPGGTATVRTTTSVTYSKDEQNRPISITTVTSTTHYPDGHETSRSTSTTTQGTITLSGFTHAKFEYIGSVKAVDSEEPPEPFGPSSHYVLYEIEQGDCLYEIKLSGGTGGGEPCDPWNYDGPFKVVQGSTTGTVEVTGIDYIEPNWWAGLLCLGSTCYMKQTEIVNGAESGVDIYANVTKEGALSYSFALETSWKYIANIRLARIESFVTYYNVSLNGTLEDTPPGDTTHKAGKFVTENSDFNPTGSIVPDTMNATGTEYIVATGEIGKIYEVTGGTFTGHYQVGGTADVTLTEEASIKQIHFGDLYVDDPDQFYNGPFKLSITGEVATGDRKAYKVTIIDGSRQIPSVGNTNYAGYSIINGSSARIPIEEHSFNLDQSSSTTVFLVGTNNGSTWSFAYDTEPGTQSAAPDLTMVEIDGETVYGSTVTVGAVIGGTTAGGVVTGGSTVTSVSGGTITAYKVIDGSTVSTDYTIPQRYAISLGSVSGDSIKQIQYGNIYIDDMGEAPAPVVGETYSGPFRVIPDSKAASGYAVKGVDTVYNNGAAVPKAGKVYIDGKFAGWADVGPATLVTDEVSNTFVYANVFLTRGDTEYTYSTCSYGDPAEAVIYGADTYTVRLAQITGTGPADIKQFHYGDIYVDSDRLVTHQDPYSYEGPFKLTCDASADPDKPLSCAVTQGAMVPGTTIGTIYIKGKEGLGVTAATGVDAASGSVIYARIIAGSIVSLATSPSSDANTYNVRLGSVNRIVDENVVIDGQTVAISGVSIGEKIGATTVTALTANSITYSYTSGGSTTTATVTASTIYSAYQYHYGDIYIDTEDTDEYNGPFKVSGGTGAEGYVTLLAFDGTVFGTTQSIIGKILVEEPAVTGSTTAKLVEKNVIVNSTTISISSNTILYAHVPMVKGATVNGKQLYTVGDPTIDTDSSYQAGEGESVDKEYTFRIAKINFGTISESPAIYGTTVTQIQYGDIYIGDPSDPIKEQVSGFTYSGPFAIDDGGGVTCPECHTEGTTNPVKPIGYYSINGGATTPALKGGTNSTSVNPSGRTVTDVYFTMDPDGWDISITGCSSPDCYEVYLGWIEGTAPAKGETAWKYKAHQLHYGNIQVDGRWS